MYILSLIIITLYDIKFQEGVAFRPRYSYARIEWVDRQRISVVRCDLLILRENGSHRELIVNLPSMRVSSDLSELRNIPIRVE